MDRLWRPVLMTAAMTRARLAPVFFAALLLAPACNRGGKEPTPEEVAAKLASDLEEAAARLRNNKRDDAEKIYLRILEQNPGHPDALAGLAKVRFDEKKYDDAEKLLVDALAKKGDAAEIHFTLGQVRQHAQRAAEAAEAYGKAYEIDAENSDYGLHYGRELKKAGKLDEAEKVLREVAELDPKAQFVFTELGDVLREKNVLDESLRTYMKAQTTYPSNKEAFAGAALVYEAQGDNARALDEWSTYITMDCCSEFSKTVAQKKLETLKVDHGGAGGEPTPG
jgi:tetratricopeptide (TPR) repeat protein